MRKRVRGHEADVKDSRVPNLTAELERLRDWLKERRVKHVAMETTGVYWNPVWNVLEPGR